MRSIALQILFGLCLVFGSSCTTDDPLPIMGRKDLDKNGQEVHHTVDDFMFLDQQGKPYVNGKADNAILVYNTFFTSCPTICPKMTDNIVSVFDKYIDADDVAFVSATVDPKKDRPERLALFMDSHDVPKDKNWHFVTGEKKALYDFARYQLYISALESVEDIDDDFIHSEKVVLIDRNRHIRGYYVGTEEDDMKRLAKDIKRLRKEK